MTTRLPNTFALTPNAVGIAAAITVLFYFVFPAAAGIEYTVTDLGGLVGPNTQNSEARAINNLGQIVGQSDTASGFAHAFLYSNGTMTDLDPGEPLVYTSAKAISDSGQVIGSRSAQAGVYSSVMFGPAITTFNGTAWAINASGQIAGDSAARTAVIWSGSQTTDLGLLGGTQSLATSINSYGDVAGSVAGTDGLNRAFVYRDGVAQSLPKIGDQSWAWAINDKGDVAGGYYPININGNGERSFIYSNGVMTDLGVFTQLGDLPNQLISPTAMNNRDQVVGTVIDFPHPYDRPHPFLYSDGTLNDLNDLIDPASGWTLIAANGINDAGQIVGEGYDSSHPFGHALLLTPTPEPSASLGLFVAAGGALLCRRRC